MKNIKLNTSSTCGRKHECFRIVFFKKTLACPAKSGKAESNALFIADWTEMIYQVMRELSEVIFRMKVFYLC